MVVGTKEPTTYHAQRMSDMHTYDGRCCFITIPSNMHVKKNLSGAISLTVTEGLSVTILPNADHEFLMSSREVAIGYGTSEYNIRQMKIRHSAELIEGKHFTSAVTICHSDPHNKIYWTKRGIVRLGFFIRSERARLFRDWAEELIISTSPQPSPTERGQRMLPTKRNHNRLTSERLIRLLALTNQIENTALRHAISNELMGKEAHNGTI